LIILSLKVKLFPYPEIETLPKMRTIFFTIAAALSAAGKGTITTEIEAAGPYYFAEDYHQGYYEQNPAQPYCQFVVAPKIAKAQAKFHDKLRQ